jgi:hypothetical protein
MESNIRILWTRTAREVGGGMRLRNANPERDIAGRGMKSETRRTRTQNKNLELEPRTLAPRNLEP